jgi:hypothetical protein
MGAKLELLKLILLRNKLHGAVVLKSSDETLRGGVYSMDRPWADMPPPILEGGRDFICHKGVKEDSKMLQVDATFMGYYNFSNIFYVNVIMCYLSVAISSDKLSFSMHLGYEEQSESAIMPVATRGVVQQIFAVATSVDRSEPWLYSVRIA